MLSPCASMIYLKICSSVDMMTTSFVLKEVHFLIFGTVYKARTSNGFVYLVKWLLLESLWSENTHTKKKGTIGEEAMNK